MNERDPLLERLRELPAPTLPVEVDARARRLAVRTFEATWPWGPTLFRRVESVALALFVIVHLCWAFQQAGFWP